MTGTHESDLLEQQAEECASDLFCLYGIQALAMVAERCTDMSLDPETLAFHRHVQSKLDSLLHQRRLDPHEDRATT